MSLTFTLAARVVAHQFGAWTDAFDHTDGASNSSPSAMSTSVFPGAHFVAGWPVRPNSTVQTFNAIHSSLVPRGPHQGKVLVWDMDPEIGRSPTHHNNYWSLQRYSFVDPRPGVTRRFYNYLLPITDLGTSSVPGVGTTGGDLFCAGHTWTRDGRMVLAGGTNFELTTGGLVQKTAKLTYLLDLLLSYGSWPSTTNPVNYEGGAAGPGRWRPGDYLQQGRYYPTVTRTHHLNRIGDDAYLVLGGSLYIPGSPQSNAPVWNTYEALKISGIDLVFDSVQSGGQTIRTFGGPGVSTLPEVDWLIEYPRCQTLTNGRVFSSGFAWRSAQVDHESPPLANGLWNMSAGQTSAYGQERVYGASVLYPNADGIRDRIMRLGGMGSSGSTSSVETCLAAVPGSGWVSQSAMAFARHHLNAVVLPDATVVVFGGESSTGYGKPPELFVGGTWQTGPLPASIRDYHSTAILLPDARVLVAGGNARHLEPLGSATATYDYEIYSPPYLTNGHYRPTDAAITSIAYSTTLQAYPLSRGPSSPPIEVTVHEELPLGVFLERIVLMAPGSTTHHSDMHARYEALPTKAHAPYHVECDPLTDDILPGYYMLFALTNQGVPAEAIWVVVQ